AFGGMFDSPANSPCVTMKKHLLVFLFGAAVAPLFAQVLTAWNFDQLGGGSIDTTATNSVVFGASTGSGQASGNHNSISMWSNPVGNGSPNSLRGNTWAVGDYFQFHSSTTGHNGIGVSWDQTGTGNGPRDFKLQYSLDHTTWTDVATYSLRTP